MIQQQSLKKRWRLRRVTARFSDGIKINPTKIIRQGGRPIYLRKLIQKFSLNEYQYQFKTKQRFKALYGQLSEKSFKRLCVIAKSLVKHNFNIHSQKGLKTLKSNKLGVWADFADKLSIHKKLYNRPPLGSSLISLLERRLDVVAFRLNLAKNLRTARLLIKSGLIKVDLAIQKSPSFIVKVGSLIEKCTGSSPTDKPQTHGPISTNTPTENNFNSVTLSKPSQVAQISPLIGFNLINLTKLTLLSPPSLNQSVQQIQQVHQLDSLKRLIDLNNQRVASHIYKSNFATSPTGRDLLKVGLSRKAFLMTHPTEHQVHLPRTISFKTLKNYTYRY